MAYGGEDPVAAGWAQSYSRPGCNITGVVLLSPELDGKRLHLLHANFPAGGGLRCCFTAAPGTPLMIGRSRR